MVLLILVDMALSRPAAVVNQLATIQAAVETQPMYMYQVAQIMGAVGTLSKVTMRENEDHDLKIKDSKIPWDFI